MAIGECREKVQYRIAYFEVIFNWLGGALYDSVFSILGTNNLFCVKEKMCVFHISGTVLNGSFANRK